MAALEQLRLELDHTRRTLANVELKKVKQERNKGHASDQVLAKASTKSTMLESTCVHVMAVHHDNANDGCDDIRCKGAIP